VASGCTVQVSGGGAGKWAGPGGNYVAVRRPFKLFLSSFFLLLGLVTREDLKKQTFDITVSGVGLAITVLHASLVALRRRGELVFFPQHAVG